MKKAVFFLVLLSGLWIFPSCGKGGDGGGSGQTNEANLVVETDPANGTVQAPSIGPFNLKVTITSTMPPNGVKIDISAKKDDGSGTVFYSTSSNTSSGVSNFSIANTPSNVQCLVEVKVTSLTKSTNQWSGSYRYSRK